MLQLHDGLEQGDRRGALGREGDALHLLERPPTDQLDAVDRPLRRDRQPARQAELAEPTPVLDGADGSEVDRAREQHAIETGGHAGHQFERGFPGESFGGALLEAEVQGIAVQELDVSYANGHRDFRGQPAHAVPAGRPLTRRSAGLPGRRCRAPPAPGRCRGSGGPARCGPPPGRPRTRPPS